MDNLTHSLTGLMMSRAGLNRFTARADWVLLAAANFPDADVISAFWGSQSYLDHHRGWTHVFALAPLWALVPAIVVGLIRRPAAYRWLQAWVISLAGIVSHLLLDWTNIYGIRFLRPFSETWYRLDITSVVDPWIWALLLLGVGWMVLSRLVSSEMGAKARGSPGVARFVLAALAAYDFGRWVVHQRAVETLESRVYQGRTPKAAYAFPSLANPFRWTGLLRFEDSWQVHAVDLLHEFDPEAGSVYFDAAPSPALEAAKRTPAFQTFARFSQAALWKVSQLPEPEGAVEVTGTDLRFARPGQGRFAVRALVSAAGHVESSQFQFGPPGKMPEPK
ncbi:MAG: metal-dependent hydrolase [Bryobacteraceae bacterium]